MSKKLINKLKGPIFIFGGSGFIGANLFKKIFEYRHDVYAITTNKNAVRLNGYRENTVVLNIKDKKKLVRVLDKYQPKTIFNLICYGAYPRQENTKEIYDVNFRYLIELINILAKREVNAFINAGTSSEYGDNCYKPKEEDHMIPNSHYSVSKLSFYYYLKFYCSKLKFPGIHLRLYSVYGPLEDKSRLIPTLLEKIKNNSLPDFVDKKISRDFVHVDDVCNAFIIAAIKINKLKFGDSFNIGTGVKTTMEDLVLISRKLFSLKCNARFGKYEKRKWDNINWVSNPTKAEKILGWKYKIGIEEGLKMLQRDKLF